MASPPFERIMLSVATRLLVFSRNSPTPWLCVIVFSENRAVVELYIATPGQLLFVTMLWVIVTFVESVMYAAPRVNERVIWLCVISMFLDWLMIMSVRYP